MINSNEFYILNLLPSFQVREGFLFIVPDVETIDKEELNNFIAERVSWDAHTSFFYFFERHFFILFEVLYLLPSFLLYQIMLFHITR
jgi:hypothetical protein